MTRKTAKHKDRHYVYYSCPTGKRNGCNSPPAINEDELICIVTRKIRERIADIEKVSAGLSKFQIKELLLNERNQQIATCEAKIRDLHRYKLHLSNSKAEGLLTDKEYQDYCDFYDREIDCLDVESSVLWKSRYDYSLDGDTLEWTQSFLQFSHMTEPDRFAVVKIIHSIRVLATKEILVNFIYQAEYEQLLRYSALGGHANGEKESQTEQLD